MIGDTYHDLETTVYDAACLCIPTISDLTTPANTAPDSGVTNGICIYLHLTTSNGPNAEQLQQITTLPIIAGSGLSYGGQLGAYAAKILPRLELEGFMDTPCTKQGQYFISQVVDSSGIPHLYGEIIAMMLEGRANVGSEWERLNPLWYRDPYGRVYNSPRIIDFTGSYVEGIPERNQFAMTLKV